MGSQVRGPQPILFLSRDAELRDAVAKRLATAGGRILGFPDVDALLAGLDAASETTLVLDTETLPEGQDIAWLMGRIEQRHGSRPGLVCLAHSGAIETRLQALRAGADAFFVRPVAPDELAARLLALGGDADDYRVLVVDDQPVAANFAARVLADAGIRTRVVGDPRRVLEILEAFRPDLVLMDLHMPGVDGIELTALIRTHEEVCDTPVVFLSSELNTGKQMETLRVGGNDFLAKPVRPERLIEVVRRGIHRFRSRPPAARAERLPPQTGGQEDGRVEGRQPSVAGDSNSERAKQLTTRVEAALRSKGFRLVYQPILALRGENDEFYETSPRLETPDGGYLSAADFLPAARRGGLLPAIDRWVMAHALDRLAQERAGHPRLRFLLSQTLETLRAEDWLPWLRDRIAARDLIRMPPILQFRLDELAANRELADTRFRVLQRLAIKTCLHVHEEDPRIPDLIGDLGIALVRLPLSAVTGSDPAHLTELVARIHQAGARIILAQIQDPQTIARIFGTGVDLIQGNFLQPPSPDLRFDFSESALA
ncbi:MAG: response regulator [Candidatus Thiosymbion ectosymbiont of Robbea hypermnestra]|nr:response regulator [Candidatus Thiosymbion ectosymbiont of Robbea hypermnestra]